MKKFIQICSILSLVFAFSVISARAQVNRQYKAEIPHQFNLGQKTYLSGTYLISVSKTGLGVVLFTLADSRGRHLETVIATVNGETGGREPELIFSISENQRYLTKILTAEAGLTIGKVKPVKQLNAKNLRAADPAAAQQVASAKVQPE